MRKKRLGRRADGRAGEQAGLDADTGRACPPSKSRAFILWL